MPLPSIYGDDEAIADPGIRADYYHDLAMKTHDVARRCGMKALTFGESGYVTGGFSVFDMFAAPRGGMVQGEE